MKREEYGENKDRNIEEKVFVIFVKEQNSWLLSANGSTNMLTS